jgi:uncharacterized iron-regulated membrane protein
MQGPGSQIGLDEAAAVANAAWPGFIATHIVRPKHAGDTFQIYLTAKLGSPAQARPQAFVDPYTGEYLGGRNTGEIDLGPRGLIPFIYKLHYSLHAGETIEWLLGVLALVWLADHMLAALLSFPTRTTWRKSFRLRRNVGSYKRTFDLHRALGLWLLPVTAVLAFSGVYFNWRSAYEAMISPFGSVTLRADQSASKLPEPLIAPAITFDGAVEAAQAHAPLTAAGAVTYAPNAALYLVRTFDRRDLIDIPQRMIAIDARSGRLVSDRHTTDGTVADAVTAWQYPLHSGKAFGWPGRIAILLAGLSTCLFVVTGFIMWRRKRRARALHSGMGERRGGSCSYGEGLSS